MGDGKPGCVRSASPLPVAVLHEGHEAGRHWPSPPRSGKGDPPRRPYSARPTEYQDRWWREDIDYGNVSHTSVTGGSECIDTDRLGL